MLRSSELWTTLVKVAQSQQWYFLHFGLQWGSLYQADMDSLERLPSADGTVLRDWETDLRKLRWLAGTPDRPDACMRCSHKVVRLGAS